MITLIARLIVQESRMAEFEDCFAQLAAKVRASEPGVRIFKLTRSREASNDYHAVEFYENEQALQTHIKNMDGEPLLMKMLDTLAQPHQFMLLDDVALP